MNRRYPLMLIFLIALLAVSITATVLAVNASMPFLTVASLLFAISACIGLYRLHLRQTETIRRAADSIAQGDLTINLRPPFADSEIAHQCARLADAIHDMRLRLSETEARNIYCSQLLEEVDTAVAVADTRHRIDWTNRAARALFGIDAVSLPSYVVKALDDGTPLVHIADGGDLNISAVRMKLDGSEKFIVTIRDIHTAVEHTEAEAWQKLIRVLTHEIMNSITPVISLSGTLCERMNSAPDDPHTREIIHQGLDVINRRCQGLTTFVGNYRKLTRMPRPSLAAVSIDNLFDDLNKLLHAPDITFTASPLGITIRADRSQLEQVFINIIRNAREARATHISVSASPAPRAGVSFTISDNGTGILPDVINRIFVPFFTTKTEGSGIGLALCRQIIVMHGGNISAESEYGKGTTFRIYLPQK